jgi:hypothetical protein
MPSPKEFVFRYNRDSATDEVVQDLDGELPVPRKDEFIVRNGVRWKVLHVSIEHAVPRTVAVYRVFVTDQF